MKIVYFFLMVITVGRTEDVFHQNDQLNSNAVIRQLFEMLKYHIKNGYPEQQVPALDPTYLDYTNLEFLSPTNVLRLHAGFANNVFSGFGDYQILETEFMKCEISIDMCVHFPAVVFKSGHYEMDGDIYESIPIRGMGRFEFNIKNFTFCGKVYLKQSDDEKSILIKKIANPNFRVQQIISRTEFDGNIDDIVNAIINDLLASYLTRFNKFIIKTYIDNVIEIINLYLNKFESWWMLATLL